MNFKQRNIQKRGCGERFGALLVSLGTLICIGVSTSAWGSANPQTTYIQNGVTVRPWFPALGDEKDWYQPVISTSQVSKNKAIAMEAYSDDGKPAWLLSWKDKKRSASFALDGNTIDLSQLPDNIGLAIEMKLHNKIRNPLSLSMDCTYPCRGSLNLKPILNAYPRKEWITLPIPLRCFAQAGTDLSKVNVPFHLQTEGKLKLSIGNVKLIQLPEDFALCR